MRAAVVFIILNGFLVTACSHLPPDNPIEEAVEEVIMDVTGFDIDLSADDEKI
jgi:hypothetical protein